MGDLKRPPLFMQRDLKMARPMQPVPYPEVKMTPQIAEALAKARANWALSAVNVYARESGADEEELVVQVIDLITNLQHLCRREELDFDEVLRAARVHYEEESRG